MPDSKQDLNQLRRYSYCYTWEDDKCNYADYRYYGRITDTVKAQTGEEGKSQVKKADVITSKKA